MKLVLVAITVGCESNIGTYRPVGLAEDTGLDLNVLADALADLERCGHLVRDQSTGELFLADFFRDNTFRNHRRYIQAQNDLLRVDSILLREKILTAVSQNSGCGLVVKNQQLAWQVEAQVEDKQNEVEEQRNPGAHVSSKHPSTASRSQANRTLKNWEERPSGIETWNAEDVTAAKKLETDYTKELISAVTQRLIDAGISPLPKRVKRELVTQQRLREIRRKRTEAEAAAQIRLSAPPAMDAAVVARGNQMLERGKRANKLRSEYCTQPPVQPSMHEEELQ
ncbi:hypothetical protein ACFONG_07340 [Uliginosibacterium paludis]|uniref:Uncharacterized protein n=1 Tax=Uliginosibacterium paludis TaxID=1615952 RepID=A0ABV2CL04_9RHOO